MAKLPDLFSDPFAEHRTVTVVKQAHLLGARFQFETGNAELLRLLESAYGDLPHYRLRRAAPRLRVRLQLTANAGSPKRNAPPRFDMLSGAGMLGGATVGSSFVVLSPEQR